jgi:1,2-diacylglycerol 3-beta-galactosyltransferase
MPAPKRILILTADAGFGHRSAANAVAAALAGLYGDQCQVDIVNPLDDKHAPFFLRDSQSDYDRIVREIPELYRIGYDASDAAVPSLIAGRALTVLLYEVMYDLVTAYQPDVILVTYPIYQEPLRAVFTINRYYVPIYTVVTDLATVHRLWFDPGVDACLVPTIKVREQAFANNMKPGQVFITGIPVHPDIASGSCDKAAVRQSLGWQPDLLTFLAVGSQRVEGLPEILNVLNHFGKPIQLAVVAGKNEQLYHQIQEMDWHVPVHLYNYVTNMPTLMHAADALICKAGGLIVTEGLACGLPMLLTNVIPGQETGNAEFVVENGAGDLVKSPLHALELTAHWLMDDGKLLKERSRNAFLIGKPEAALTVARLLWKAAQVGPLDQKGKRIPGRPDLVSILNRYRVDLRHRLQLSRSKPAGKGEDLHG